MCIGFMLKSVLIIKIERIVFYYHVAQSIVLLFKPSGSNYWKIVTLEQCNIKSVCRRPI